nr:MAG TPA: hypothetical protein [Caudoviricetes sp.]
MARAGALQHQASRGRPAPAFMHCPDMHLCIVIRVCIAYVSIYSIVPELSELFANNERHKIDIWLR